MHRFRGGRMGRVSVPAFGHPRGAFPFQGRVMLMLLLCTAEQRCAIGFKRIRFAHFDRLCGPDITMSPLYAFVYVKITRTHQEMR